jgi:tRNA(Ile)-lysidine synthase
VLIGLSGGSDSVALTHLLLELAPLSEFHLVGLAHLHHGLRPSADSDEAFCRQLAGRLGLPLVLETADIRTYARTERLSIEDAARRARYAFFDRAAAELGADRVAVGHTQDDQAETFLLKLMRGAGLTGLGSIYPRRGIIVRPLLDVRDAELRAYLTARGEKWVEDETNDDLDNPRNRVRHRVLPELDRAAGAPTHAAIARAAALIREDGKWLDELSHERFRAVALETDSGLQLDARTLAGMPVPVLRRVILMALRQVAGGREIGVEHVEAVRELVTGMHGGVDVPGSRAELRCGKLVLYSRGAA